MKIVSFNIRSRSDANGHSISERAPRVKELIDRCDPDIIGFQEVIPEWMEHIPDDYGEKYEIFHKFRDDTRDIEGSPILWKKDVFDCLDKGYFWYSDTPDVSSKGWDSIGCFRICMWAKLCRKADGKVFWFYNTHFGFGDQCQLDSVDLLFRRMDTAGADTVIMTGDFNMHHHYKAYAAMTERLADLNMMTAKNLNHTFHGYDLNCENKTPIDYCFITPETVTPVSYRRMDEIFEGKFPSDHYGLEIEAELK